MTQHELVKVMEVINSVDGGCNVCAGKAAVTLAKLFPRHAEQIQRIYQDEYGGSFDDIRKEWFPPDAGSRQRG